MRPRLRFAPSLSGHLHVRDDRTALFSWLWARKQGERCALTVEDAAQRRSPDCREWPELASRTGDRSMTPTAAGRSAGHPLFEVMVLGLEVSLARTRPAPSLAAS